MTARILIANKTQSPVQLQSQSKRLQPHQQVPKLKLQHQKSHLDDKPNIAANLYSLTPEM